MAVNRDRSTSGAWEVDCLGSVGFFDTRLRGFLAVWKKDYVFS